MAETSMCLKRHREEEFLDQQEVEEKLKRHRPSSSSSSSYNQILSILEEDVEEPNQDLSYLVTNFQQEISSEPSSESKLISEPSPDLYNPSHLTSSNSFQLPLKEDEDDKERVIRHLLEASDDELGIPNSEEEIQATEDLFGEREINGGGEFEFSICDNLWEFEDNTANYYTLLQLELFL